MSAMAPPDADAGRAGPPPPALPAPAPLEGVKSKKRAVFEVPAFGLKLTLASRIAAVGEAGQAAIHLLVGEAAAVPCATEVVRHPGLTVMRLGPRQLAEHIAEGTAGYEEAMAAALARCRPHVVLLEEALEVQDAAWALAFGRAICGEQLRDYRGAVVVCAAGPSKPLVRLCGESWSGTADRLQQEPCLEVIEDALGAGAEAEPLLEEARAVDSCDLGYWLDKAATRGWTATCFASGGSSGSGRLCGLVFHHLIESRAEFHVRFIFVPRSHRGCGLGGRLVRWVIKRAAQMPQAQCRWISLDAADDKLVPWYETFGFVDMSCGHQEGDYGQTWMEMKNPPSVPGAVAGAPALATWVGA